MDPKTLAVANLLLFLLYAAFMTIQARLLGQSRAAHWFSSASAIQAAAMLALVLAGRLPHGTLLFATGGALLVIGALVLHRSFTELLDRSLLLWRLHLTLLAVVLVGSGVVLWFAPGHPVLTLLVSAILGIQAALTASALFSFAGDGVESAGRFAGVALCLYSLVNLMRAAVTLRYASWQYRNASVEMDQIWLTGCLLANGAAAFGFMFLSSARLRVELLWRAQIDELTGLLNRWAFKRIAVKETLRCMRLRSRLAVVMMDLDGMKGINDRLGHSCGDAVLQAVSSTLQAAVRDRDSIARMGGDEFCILLPDADLQEAVTVAERVRSQIDALAIRYGGELVKVRASFGVSSTDRNGWNWQDLMDLSDAALYEAKRGGNQKVIAAAPTPPAIVETPEQLDVPVERRRSGR